MSRRWSTLEGDHFTRIRRKAQPVETDSGVNARMGRQLKCELGWTAVAHYNTEHRRSRRFARRGLELIGQILYQREQIDEVAIASAGPVIGQGAMSGSPELNRLSSSRARRL